MRANICNKLSGLGLCVTQGGHRFPSRAQLPLKQPSTVLPEAAVKWWYYVMMLCRDEYNNFSSCTQTFLVAAFGPPVVCAIVKADLVPGTTCTMSNASRRWTLYHEPGTRSSKIVWLFKELDVEVDLVVFEVERSADSLTQL